MKTIWFKFFFFLFWIKGWYNQLKFVNLLAEMELEKEKEDKSDFQLEQKYGIQSTEFQWPHFQKQIMHFFPFKVLNNCQEANASPAGCSKIEYRNMCEFVCLSLNQWAIWKKPRHDA